MTRWERLFDDLEAQLGADAARELRWEVADRTRRERALVDLQARLLGCAGRSGVVVRTPAGALTGEVCDAGSDWLLIKTARGPVLVPLPAVRAVTGLGSRTEQPSLVAKGFGIGAALRAISRNRAPVEVVDLDGRVTAGTIDVVAADHLQLAEHPLDQPRRPANITALVVVPFAALAAVAQPDARRFCELGSGVWSPGRAEGGGA